MSNVAMILSAVVFETQIFLRIGNALPPITSTMPGHVEAWRRRRFWGRVRPSHRAVVCLIGVATKAVVVVYALDKGLLGSSRPLVGGLSSSHPSRHGRLGPTDRHQVTIDVAG